MVDDEKIHAVMQANAAKRSKGKKSKFQQRYEELAASAGGRSSAVRTGADRRGMIPQADA